MSLHSGYVQTSRMNLKLIGHCVFVFSSNPMKEYIFWHQITSNVNKLFPFQTFNINEKHAFLPYLFSIIYNVQDGAMVRTNCTEFDSLIASLLILNWLIETLLISMLINLCVDAYFLYFIEFYYRLIEYRMAMVDDDCAGLLNHCTIYLLISPWIVLLWCYSCEAYIQNNSLGKKEIQFFLKT